MRIRPPGEGRGLPQAQGDRGRSHIDHGRQLLPKAPHVRAAAAVRILPIVKDGKAVPQEVGSASRVELGAGLRGFHTPSSRPLLTAKL